MAQLAGFYKAQDQALPWNREDLSSDPKHTWKAGHGGFPGAVGLAGMTKVVSLG